MSLSLRAGRAALAEDMGMTLLPRTHSIMALCCWRCALCDERGGVDWDVAVAISSLLATAYWVLPERR